MILDNLLKRSNGRAETFLRRNHPYLTIHLSYAEEDGWFVVVEEIAGALAYADSFAEALGIISASVAGSVGSTTSPLGLEMRTTARRR